MKVWKQHIEDHKDSTGETITLEDAKKVYTDVEFKEIEEMEKAFYKFNR